MLLIGAGLMIRTFQALRRTEPGFAKPEEVQLMRISIPEEQIKESARVTRLENDFLDKLAAVPGVKSVAYAASAPLEGFNNYDPVVAEDKNYEPGQIPPLRKMNYVSPGFFQTSGIPLKAGRDYTWSDLYDKHDVAIVAESLARELWGSAQAAVGKRIRESSKDPWREVIGVVADVYDDGVQQKAPTLVYWPALMKSVFGDDLRVSRDATLLIRTPRAGTSSLLNEVKQALWSVNSAQPVFLVRTLGDVYNNSMARTSFTLVILAIAAVMALMLSIIGIYGVIAYAVSQRTREIGIRMALGAEPMGVMRMFVSHGLKLAIIGAVLGLATAAVLTHLMASLLFGITALDPTTYGVVSFALILAAALASYLPARRATAIDPGEALRVE
jgi:predicted permease